MTRWWSVSLPDERNTSEVCCACSRRGFALGAASNSSVAPRLPFLPHRPVLPLEEAFHREMDRVRNCTPPGTGALKWGTPACWPKGVSSDISKSFIVRGVYLAQVRKPRQPRGTVERRGSGCVAGRWSRFPASRDAASRLQLMQWRRHFSKEQILVVAQGDLLHRPRETMERVFRHTWLPPFDVEHIKDADIANM